MAHADFVHLRVHTAYSLLEGAIRIGELTARCRVHDMPAVAMTDTDNIFGAYEFSAACAADGIQPIIGCQLGLAREDGGGGGAGRHNGGLALAPDPLVLLVCDETGYGNLLKLVSRAHQEAGEGSPPNITMAMLEAFSRGLLLLTGGAAGVPGRLLAEGQSEAAEKILSRLAKAFPGRLYVELARHGLKAEAAAEPGLIDLAYRHDLPMVATNEAFFTDADMYEAHDALLCIAEGTHVAVTDRRRLTPEHRFKSAAEMRALFADLPEAVDNTLTVARRCAFMVEDRSPILPAYDCGEGRGEEEELREQARRGLEGRLEKHILTPGMSDQDRQRAAKPYRERLDYELGIIVEMGFAGYFLIVADFIGWAKEKGIPVGPGRGSGAGSVVSWALLITDLDPLRFGLLFERFLNPERVSMPDFDIDFCQDRRDEVIRYVQERYGVDRVAQIITFGTLQARAVLRDVGRVLEMPYSQVDRISKMVPFNPAKPVTLDQAIAGEPRFKQMVEEDPTVARLVDIARRLEGLYRHASTHAAGVVIGDRPLEELIPLSRDPRSGTLITGFNMKYVEKAGLVKFDFLGLKTLTVLSTAVKLLDQRGIRVDLSSLPLDDRPTFEMLERGDTTGVFQLESSGMRDILRKLKPDTFEDIIAVVALFRPGPMDNIPSYVRRKHGDEVTDYLYPTLEGILKETFGIMIYQEQVMQIAQELSGYTLGGADILRRAMGKKIKSEMNSQRGIFVDGAMARGVPESKARDIFEQVAKFAGYGFNKSHAAAYALVAYQTAWLKANHPVEFLAASMTLDLGNTDKLGVFRQALRELDIPLLPPDVNASGDVFTVEREDDGKGAIRYALAAIKNVGGAAMRALVEERRANGPFANPFDFARRLDNRVLNKRQLENLVRAGAFDRLEGNRRRLFEGIEYLLRIAGAAANDRESGQFGLFTDAPTAIEEPALPEVADWAPMDRLREEFDAIGFYLSAHPLDQHEGLLRRLGVRSFSEVLAEGRTGPVKLAGTVLAKRERTSGRGNRYAFVQLSDASDVFEVTVFSELLASHGELLEAGQALFIKATAQFEDDTPRLTVQAMEPLERAAANSNVDLRVFLATADPLAPLKQALAGNGGGARGRVTLVSRLDTAKEVDIQLPGRFAISPEVVETLRALPGVEGVEEV